MPRLRGIIVGVLLACLAGCTVGGKSMSIDSNSRAPFFGLELKERDRGGDKTIRSIARQQDDQPKLQTLAASAETKTNWKWWGFGSGPSESPSTAKAIALPRTDLSNGHTSADAGHDPASF